MKLKERFYDKPDATTVSLLLSIKQNPNFQKLIAFSLNCLYSQMYLPNTKHRDNSIYIFQEGQSILIQCLQTHKQSDQIIYNVCGCLNRMIGLHKFRDEYISKNVIESNFSQVISTITNQQLSIETIRAIIEIYQNLTFTQLLTDSLAKSKILVGFLQMLIISKPPIQEIQKIFDLEYKLLVQNCIIENIDVHELTTYCISLMSEFVDNPYVIKETLRILLLLINHKGSLQIIKEKQSIPIKNMIEILLQHNDITINDRGALILQSIVNLEEIEKCIQSIKQLNQQAEYSMSLLACLIPAIFQQINLEELIQILFDILKNYKKIQKRKPIIRDTLNCLSRLCDSDSDYIIKLKHFLPLMNDLYESDDSEVVQSSFELSRKLSINATIEELNKIIEKVIASMQSFKGLKEGLRLLFTLATRNDKTYKAISKGKELYLKIVDVSHNQTAQEYNGKLLLLLLSELKDYINKKLQIIVQFVQKHYNWKRALLNYVQILNRFPEQLVNVKQNLIISIFSCNRHKDYITIINTLKSQKVDSEAEEDDPDDAITEFTQNGELQNQFLQLAKNLTKQDDLKQLHKDILSNKNNDELSQIMLEIQLQKIALYIQLEPEYYLKNNYFNEIKVLMIQLLKQFKIEQIDIYINLFYVLQIISKLFWNDQFMELYSQKQISQALFDIIFQSFDNEELLEQSLDTIFIMGKRCRETDRKLYYLLDIQDNSYVIQLIGSLQIFMKKYVQKEKIQIKILDVIRIYLLFDLFKQNIRDLPKILCRKLPEDTTTKEIGMETITILQELKFSDNALKYITLFQLQHQYDLNVINQASLYIKHIEKIEADNFLTQILKDQIKNMIQYFNQIEDIDIASEYMDKLSVFSMIAISLEFEFDNDILKALINSLDYCQQNKNNDRLLCSTINILTQMINSNYIDPMEIPRCLYFLQQKRHSENPVCLITNYLAKCQATIEEEQLQLILDLMEEYQRNEPVCQNLQEIIHRTCLKSKEVSQKLADRRFISRLLLQTQELMMEQNNAELAKKNLEWLESLSQVETVAQVILKEKGKELCYLIIKLDNQQYIGQALKILAGLGKCFKGDQLNQFLEYLKQKQFIPQTLNALDILLTNEQIKNDFIQQNGQNIIQQYYDDYPDLCQKLLTHFKPQQVIQRQSILKQRQSLLEQKQQLLLQQMQKINEQSEHYEKSSKGSEQDDSPQNKTNDTKELIDKCLSLAQNDPQAIIDEGLLEKLFQIEESWEVFNKLTQKKEIAEQLLQPDSKLYKQTLNGLKDIQNQQAEHILETAGNICQVPQTLYEFGKTDGPLNMVQLIENQKNNPQIVISGISALKKVCQDEMILNTIGETNALQLPSQLLNQYKENPDVIKNCDEMISQLSVSQDYQDKMVEQGIIQQLIDQIQQNKDDEQIIIPAIEALSKLAFKNGQNQKIIMDSNILEQLYESQIGEKLDYQLLNLINNLCYKNDEIRKKINIKYLIRIFEQNIKNYNEKIIQECVNIIFGLANNVQHIDLMIKLNLINLIAEFIKIHQDKHESLFFILNLELKIAAQTKILINEQIIQSIIICLQIEKLEQQALRLVRYFLQDGYDLFDKCNIYLHLSCILKKFDSASCILVLDVMLKMAALNRDSISKFEHLNITLEFSEVLRMNKTDKKLFELILDYSLKLFQKSNELANQIIAFIEQNEINELQIDKSLLIIEQVDDNEIYIPILINLMQKNNHRHTKTVSIILSRESKIYSNQIYVNKGIEVSILELENTKDREIILNLGKVILDVAKSLEEYRQAIAEQYLERIQKLNESSLQELIKLLQGPKKQISKLTDEIKNFLIKGEVLKMYKDDGSRGYYRFFCDQNLAEVKCRQESTKIVKQKWILKVTNIQEIKAQYDKKQLSSSAFENQNWLIKQIHKFKNKVIDPNRCFSLFAIKNIKPKSMNALCKSESQKNKWVEYIKILSDEQTLLQQQQQ